MTDRIKGLVVTLQEDMREDDAERLVAAIGMMRGVVHIAPVPVGIDDFINRKRIRQEIRLNLWNAIEAMLGEV